VGIVAAVIVAAFAVRVVTSAADELAQGDAARASGAWDVAVAHYRRGARWYAPGSPYHVRALDALARIARDAERRGDTELALSTHRAVRAAILSTRSFYTPETRRLATANRRIAAIMATLPAPPMDAGKSQDALRVEHLAMLEADDAPKLAWTLVLLAGFFAWVGGAFAFTLRAIDANDRWIVPEARRWSVVIAVGFAAFVVGMLCA
jgi:hypothetical protein